MLDQGFITGDELERSEAELEAAEADLAIARRRASVLVEQTHPLNQRRAELQLGSEARAAGRGQPPADRRPPPRSGDHLALIERMLHPCGRARGWSSTKSSWRRRRVERSDSGDRVTPSQGIVRVVEVDRMLVDTSVPERSVHRVRPGQPVTVRLEAFPDLQLVRSASPPSACWPGRPGSGWSRPSGSTSRWSWTRPTAELRPEMTARVDIRVGERRNVVTRVPVNALFERDGLTIVNVLSKAAGSRRARSTSGMQNQRFVEVLEGVAEEERVMLVGEPVGGDAPPAAMEPGGATRDFARGGL